MNRTLLWAVLAIFFLGAGQAKEEANKKDLERLQGDWAAISYVRDGLKYPDDDAQALFRTHKGNLYVVYRFEMAVGKGTFSIDATQNPKTIDAMPANLPPNGKPLLGIYEIEGENLKLCFAAPGKERPKEFSSKEGSGNLFSVYTREKK